VIGAGTYARDGVCALSGTGKGEFFIRHVVGHEVAARMAYLGEDVKAAATKVIMEDLKPHNIGAGLVAVGADGSVAAPYNTDGMFRGWVTNDGELDRKSTRLNSSHVKISYAVFCLKKKKQAHQI